MASPLGDVLVVDDDDKLAGLLVRAFERAGFRCRRSATGDEALWAVNESPPAALILDVMIPHPSGLEVCRHLRAVGFTGPIVVISARGEPADQAAALRSGADRFLAKPFALSMLVEDLGERLASRAG